MRYIYPVDFANFPTGWHSEVLAGPKTGFDQCYVVCSRVQPGSSGPALHTHRADQLYYVVSGRMYLQLGDYKTTADPGTLVRIPEGTPHHNWNEGSEDEVHLEFIAPAPAWDEILVPAEVAAVQDPESYFRRPGAVPTTHWAEGFDIQFLANRKSGSSKIAVNVASVEPGYSGPDFHIHSFDQFYFVLEGTLSVDIGFAHYEVPPMSLVALPAGVVHRQRNDGTRRERHVAAIVPEPLPGDRLDHEVQIKSAPIKRE